MMQVVKKATAHFFGKVAVGGTAALLGISAVTAQASTRPTVVFVHGAFADGSSWNKVIPRLEHEGIRSVSVQNPLTSLKDDVAATERAIADVKGPVVLVGHSWAGMVITQAGMNPRVKGLVYVAAFAPDKGQSIEEIEKGMPKPRFVPDIRKDRFGFLHLTTPSVEKDFAGDLPRVESRLLAVTQGPWAARTLAQPVTAAAWKTRPSWDVVTEADHMIPPELQESMAHHIHAHTTRIDSSHVVMLSQPQAVANVITDAVNFVKQH